LFSGGLKAKIRFLVRMFNPKTLIEAYSLAKIQEENILNNGKGTRPWLANLSKNSMVGGNAEVAVSYGCRNQNSVLAQFSTISAYFQFSERECGHCRKSNSSCSEIDSSPNG
jgi:hypothetical protein